MKHDQKLLLLKLSYLSGLSYAGNGWDKFGYELKYDYNHKGNQFYIIENAEECVIVFRGTDEVRDIFNDVNIGSYDSVYGRIHRGVFNIWNQISYKLRENLPLSKKIYITGHSLGGALAQIAGLFIPNECVVTFGAPKIFHPKDTHLIRFNHIRVRNCNDVVTKIPYNFTHIGELVYLDYNGRIKTKVSFMDNVKAHIRAWSKKQWFDGVYDHKLTLYQYKLSNLANYES